MAINDVDSDQAGGTSELPASQSSAGKGTDNSIDAATLQTTIEKLTKRLDEVDLRARTVQGEKDNKLKRTSDEVDELKRKFVEIEKLRKSGLGDDDAVEEFTFREDVRVLRDQLGKLDPVQARPAGNGESSAVDVAKVIKDYNLDGNDPEVIAQVLSKTFTSVMEAENAALKLSYRRANPNTPSPGASTAFVGETPTKDENDISKITDSKELYRIGAKQIKRR